jgi:hypothetical protein
VEENRSIMVRFASIVIVGSLSAALFLACGDKQNPLGDSTTPDASGTVVSYSQTIAPLMAANCAMSGCHGGANPTMGIGLDTYDNVKTYAALSNKEIKASSMPPSGSGLVLSAADIQNFQDWVAAGAPNN